MKHIDNRKIKYDVLPDERSDMPILQEAKLTYMQNANCVSDRDETEHLTIEVQNGGISSEDAFLTISTNKWSINGIDDLNMLIDDFESRILK